MSGEHTSQPESERVEIKGDLDVDLVRKNLSEFTLTDDEWKQLSESLLVHITDLRARVEELEADIQTLVNATKADKDKLEARVESLERVRDEVINPEKWYDFDHVDGNPDHTFSVCMFCGGGGDDEKDDPTLVEHLNECPIGTLIAAREHPEGESDPRTKSSDFKDYSGLIP